MTALIYYCVVLPLSFLPMSVLCRFSDLTFLFVFRVVRYRKKVVYENLARSFPEKSAREIDSIARDFYRHFCDLIWESIKAFSISDREIRERMVGLNSYLLDPYYQAGRPLILVGGHYGNWEWLGLALERQVRYSSVAIYKPLSNRFVDRKMREARGQYGLELLPIKAVPEFFARLGEKSARPRPEMVIFASDQSPGDGRKAYWMDFLGQDTATIFGPEKYARQCNLPVIYCVIRKKKRGYYEFEFREVSDDPRPLPHGAIIEKSNRLLEEDIRREPRYWLWTHRRWKHRRPTA